MYVNKAALKPTWGQLKIQGKTYPSTGTLTYQPPSQAPGGGSVMSGYNPPGGTVPPTQTPAQVPATPTTPPAMAYQQGTTAAPITPTYQNYAQQYTPQQPMQITGPEADYLRNIPTGLTAQQQLAMKTAATNTAAAGARGTAEKLKERMAASGLSGGGYETSALANALLGNQRNLQNQMTNIDLSNAQMDLQNQYNKGGLMQGLINTGAGMTQFYGGLGEQGRQFDIGNQSDLNKYFAGLGEQGRQFDIGNYSNMYKWGSEQDYQRYQDAVNRGDYMTQLAMMRKLMGMA